MNPSIPNRRKRPRILRRDEMLASFCLEGEDAVEQAVVTHCQAQDASPDGIGIISRREAAPGIRVDLWIDFAGFPRKLYLSGVVGNCVPTETHGRFRLGIALRNEHGTDINEWRSMMLAVADSPHHLMLLA
ncbi:MAG: PilZ domain-containing protein [Gammaproteobacteria bacterium]|nr:PilZ domain-containing protein [Gammaproteobacteria bacterium]